MGVIEVPTTANMYSFVDGFAWTDSVFSFFTTCSMCTARCCFALLALALALALVAFSWMLHSSHVPFNLYQLLRWEMCVVWRARSSLKISWRVPATAPNTRYISHYKIIAPNSLSFQLYTSRARLFYSDFLMKECPVIAKRVLLEESRNVSSDYIRRHLVKLKANIFANI